MLMPKACQPPPPRPTQNARPAARSGAERCPARSDCRQLQPTRQPLETTSLIYVSTKCLRFGSHEIPGISILTTEPLSLFHSTMGSRAAVDAGLIQPSIVNPLDNPTFRLELAGTFKYEVDPLKVKRLPRFAFHKSYVRQRRIVPAHGIFSIVIARPQCDQARREFVELEF